MRKQQKRFKEKEPPIRRKQTKATNKSVWFGLEVWFWYTRVKTYKSVGYSYEDIQKHFNVKLDRYRITNDIFDEL